MSKLSPEFLLKRSGQSTSDLNFWSCNEKSILLAAYNGKAGIDMWNLATRRSMLNIPSDISVLSACGFGSKEIVSLDKEGNLKLIDVVKEVPTNKVRLSVPNVGFCKAAVIENCRISAEQSHFIAVPGETKSSINVWNLSESKIVKRLIPPNCHNFGMPWGIKLLFLKRLIAIVGYEDGSMLCWDVMEEKIISKFVSMFNEPIMCFDACIDSQTDESCLGVSGSVTDIVFKWKTSLSQELISCKNSENQTLSNFDDFENFSTLKTCKLLNPGLACLKIRSDKKIFASGGWDYKVRVFSLKSLKPLAVLDYHTNTVQAIAFSNDLFDSKQLLACGSVDNTISLWNLFSDK